MGDYLQLTPSELKFKFELRKNIPVTLSLYNPSDEVVAFKVKTTAPKKYCVRPSSGVVEPKVSKEIQVIMQAQRENPASFADCKDKFLVQSCLVDRDVKDVSGDVFDKAGEVKQTKLRVVLMSPPKPPSPVPEGDEEDYTLAPGDQQAPPTRRDDDNATDLSSEDIVAVTKERNKLREQVKKLEWDRDAIKRRLDLLEDQGRGAGPTGAGSSGGKQSLLTSGTFTLAHIVAAATVAFVLALFF